MCVAVLLSCSKTNGLPQSSNNNIQPVTPVTIRIDTTINYTPVYYPWMGSQKKTDFPELDGISNPVINVYYKPARQTNWKILPEGYLA